VLWVLRDKIHLFQCVHSITLAVTAMRDMSYKYSSSLGSGSVSMHRMQSVWLTAKMHEVGVDADLQSAWTWIKETMLYDKWDRVKMLMLGADRKSLRSFFDQWHTSRLAAEDSKRQAQFDDLRKEHEGEMEALHTKYQQEMEDGQQRMRSMLQAKAQEVKEVQELLENAQARLADEMEQAALQKAALAAAPQKLRQKLGALAPGMLPAPPNTPTEGGRFLLPKDGMDGNDEDGEDQDAEMLAKIKFIDRVLKRWKLQEVGSAFDTWRSFVKSQQQLMKSAAKVVGHWLHRGLALAYETWHAHAHAQARMRGILKRIAERWLHRDVAVAFMSWKENADKQKRAEYITGRILRHWTHRTSAAAFDSWHEHAQEQVM
jgi:hypothetical protein